MSPSPTEALEKRRARAMFGRGALAGAVVGCSLLAVAGFLFKKFGPDYCYFPPETPPPEAPPKAGKLDFGDAADPTYPSLLASDGARVELAPFWLGFQGLPPTVELDAKITDRDELDDGLRELAVEDETASLTFQAVLSLEASGPAVLFFNLLADLDGNGIWQGREEWINVNTEVSLDRGQTVLIVSDLTLPADMKEMWIRATLTESPVSRSSGDEWDGSGILGPGEVEDYLIHRPTIKIKEPLKAGGNLTLEGSGFHPGHAHRPAPLAAPPLRGRWRGGVSGVGGRRRGKRRGNGPHHAPGSGSRGGPGLCRCRH